MHRRLGTVLLVVAIALLAACGASPTPTPAPTATTAPTATIDRPTTPTAIPPTATPLAAPVTATPGLPLVSPARVLSGAPGEVRAVVFSPDGARVASGDADGGVRIWDPATGQ